MPHCLILGAGMAGLTAARYLERHAIHVTLLDKGRGVGGRMATRRLEWEGRTGFCDHGAQFFTVRDPLFQETVEDWLTAGVVQEWCRGFANPEGHAATDGHPRYRGTASMNAIPKQLAAGLEVRTGAQVTAVFPADGGWRVETAAGETYSADALLMTSPVPQSLALLAAGGIALPEEQQILDNLAYEPCLALLLALEAPSGLPAPGAIQFPEEPAQTIRWMADNQQKGISPALPAITIHAAPAFSHEYYQAPEADVTHLLLENSAVRRWLGANVVVSQLHRWRYSRPTHPFPQPFLEASGSAPLYFAGDAFGGSKVEGAFLSGYRAAEALLKRLTEGAANP